MAKKFQALKFNAELEEDLKFLSGLKGMSYNAYVERVLSIHVVAQRSAIKGLLGRGNGSGSKVSS
jgi:hypothetical protein